MSLLKDSKSLQKANCSDLCQLKRYYLNGWTTYLLTMQAGSQLKYFKNINAVKILLFNDGE